jgi:uncharacterized protein
MKLEQSFSVQAPIDRVWEALVDVERVAPCLPGAEITDAGDDGSYSGSFQVRLGPTTAAYRGTIRLESLDQESRTATMKASGQDKRGQGGANATIVSRMREDGGETQVDVVTDFTITGRLARFGRGGMIQDISNRLLRDFATCLQSMLEEGEAPADAAEIAAAAAAPDGGSGPPSTASPEVPVEGAPSRARGPERPGAPAGRAPPGAASGGSPQGAPARSEPVQGFSLLAGVVGDRIKRSPATAGGAVAGLVIVVALLRRLLRG